MKYWGFLLAKLAAAGLLIWATWLGLGLLARPAVFLSEELAPFTHDLGYTILMMAFFAFCAGLVYLVIWDQRYRCRTCLRRLRMPMQAGSWKNMMLFGQPRTEYICIYGHGTLSVPEVQITGTGSSAWEPHGDDVLKELESLEESKK